VGHFTLEVFFQHILFCEGFDQINNLLVTGDITKRHQINSNFLPRDSRDELEELTRSGLLTDILNSSSSVPFHILAEGPHDIDDGLFMEKLINNVRNNVIDFQSYI
jgi:hypothetical protein